jgi:hypothetical protein
MSGCVVPFVLEEGIGQAQLESSSKLQEGEGCNIYGTMEVARVTGSFTVAPVAASTIAGFCGFGGFGSLPAASRCFCIGDGFGCGFGFGVTGCACCAGCAGFCSGAGFRFGIAGTVPASGFKPCGMRRTTGRSCAVPS